MNRHGDAAIRDEFEQAYRQRLAFLMPDRALVIEAISVEAVSAGERTATGSHVDPVKDHRLTPANHVLMYCAADEQPAGWRQAALHVGDPLVLVRGVRIGDQRACHR